MSDQDTNRDPRLRIVLALDDLAYQLMGLPDATARDWAIADQLGELGSLVHTPDVVHSPEAAAALVRYDELTTVTRPV